MRKVDVVCAAALADEGDCKAAGVWLAAVTDCHDPDIDMDDPDRAAAIPPLPGRYVALLSVEVLSNVGVVVRVAAYPPILLVAAASDARVGLGLDGCAEDGTPPCGLLLKPHGLDVEEVDEAGGFQAEAPTIRTSD